MRQMALIIAALAWLLLSGQRAGASTSPNLKVLTSFLPLYCFTVNVAGDVAEVENLLPAGASPHDYSFSRRDLQKVQSADLIVVNGLGLDDWLHRLIEKAGSSKSVAVATTGLRHELIYGSVELNAPGAPPEPGAAVNPHIWLDPQLALHAVTNIMRALQKADPAHEKNYELNARSYAERLRELDGEISRRLAPFKNASIVTQHDSFRYFARRYGLRLVGVIEPAPEVGPSPKYLSALRRVIREAGVKAIFSERGESDRLARQLARELNVPSARLDTLESGALKPNAYEAAMLANAEVLEKCLR